jgi:hypothetical protein
MDYTREDLLRDMEILRKMGLIEVVGMQPDGEWLWGPTKKSLEMTEEEREALIEGTYDDYFDD